MLLQELVNGLETKIKNAAADCQVSGVNNDTRQLEPGEIFVACRGHATDGHRYLDEAVAQGAAALVVDKNKQDYLPEDLSIPVILVDSPKKILTNLLCRFYGRPDRELTLIGITGTNGKTTTTHLVESIMEAEGESVGLIGTIERRFNGSEFAVDCTTPSLVETYRCLREWADSGATAAVMEVSSHGLDQGRVKGLSFAAAGFTNLSQDHLDYHGEMEEYYQSKKKLFQQSSTAVVYVGDKYARRLSSELDAVSVGPEEADYSVVAPESTLSHTRLKMQLPQADEVITFESPLTGRHNYKNMALAVALTAELGIQTSAIKEGLATCDNVPGRCEKVASSPTVVVDYAHTPAAVENVIKSMKPLTEGRLICVFGAGGDRDRGKRPAMGEAVNRLADYAVVTSDNPRSEEPAEIIDDILVGMEAGRFHVQLDRGQAIREAVERAAPEDLVLILGKGHETEQVIGDRVIPFDDARVAREVLKTS